MNKYLSFGVETENPFHYDPVVKKACKEVGIEYDGSGYGFGSRDYFVVGSEREWNTLIDLLREKNVPLHYTDHWEEATPTERRKRMSSRKARCPNGCNWEMEHSYPFYAHPNCLGIGDRGHQVPIFVNEDLSLSNTYVDGVRGVSDEEKTHWEEYDDCLPHCVVCQFEVEWTHAEHAE